MVLTSRFAGTRTAEQNYLCASLTQIFEPTRENNDKLVAAAAAAGKSATVTDYLARTAPTTAAASKPVSTGFGNGF